MGIFDNVRYTCSMRCDNCNTVRNHIVQNYKFFRKQECQRCGYMKKTERG